MGLKKGALYSSERGFWPVQKLRGAGGRAYRVNKVARGGCCLRGTSVLQGQPILRRQRGLHHRFSTAGPRPGTGPWHQLYRAARDSPGICHFSFLTNFHG